MAKRKATRRVGKKRAASTPPPVIESMREQMEERKEKERAPCDGSCGPSKCDAHASDVVVRARARAKGHGMAGPAFNRQDPTRGLPPPTDDMLNARSRALVRRSRAGMKRDPAGPDEDAGGHIVIQMRIEGLQVDYVFLDELGSPAPVKRIDVATGDVMKFKEKYEPVEGYPVERAARLFVGYAQDLGATEEAMAELATLVHVTDKEKETAMAKNGKPGIKSKKAKGGGAKERKGADVRGKVKGEAAEKASKGPSKADRYKELILEGGRTNAEIVEVVAGEFGLALDDATKKSQLNNLAFYRAALKKEGKNPPPALRPKKEEAEAAEA